MNEKILILHAGLGSIHGAAAKAVEAALSFEAPQASVKTVDILDLAGPLFRRVYGGARRRALGERLSGAVQRWSLRPVVELATEGGWDAIVHTHFLSPALLAPLRRSGRLSAPQLTVVTDDGHPVWADAPADRYCVGGPAAAAALQAAGVPWAAIDVTGVPVDPSFAAPGDKASARRSLALAPDRPVVLLSAGCRRGELLEESFRALLASSVPSEVIALCGGNEAARRRLSAIHAPPRHRVRILASAERRRELMSAADLLVARPEGVVVGEALACGLPLAMIGWVPGSEPRGGSLLRERGAAVRAGSPLELTAQVEALLSSAARRDDMSRRARGLARPRAAYSVAARALELAHALPRERTAPERPFAPLASVPVGAAHAAL